VGGRLALFPGATRLVVSLDLSKIRGTPNAAKLAELAAQSQADRDELQQLEQRTGFDPVRHIDSLVVAFPEEARRRGELGLVIRSAQKLDQTRLIAYARDQLQKKSRGERGGQPDDLQASTRGRFTLWSATSDPGTAGFFVDDRTFVLGAGGWATQMADLAGGASPGDSAETNLELVQLSERVAANHPLWAAAIVPPETRQMLAAEGGFKSAASVERMAAGVELGRGLDALLFADLSSKAEAQALAKRTTDFLREGKRNAEVLMLGLGPQLDGITSKATGNVFQLQVTLTQEQTSDLLGRAAAYLALARQGRAPGFGGPPVTPTPAAPPPAPRRPGLNPP
jgi:hypothetical protein